LKLGSLREAPSAVISGVVVTGSFACAAVSVKLLPPSTAFWTLSTRSSTASLRFSAVGVVAI